MCPQPVDFGPEYRRLVATYRLTPEAACRQLEEILERFCDDGNRKPNQKSKIKSSTENKKGGAPK